MSRLMFEMDDDDKTGGGSSNPSSMMPPPSLPQSPSPLAAASTREQRHAEAVAAALRSDSPLNGVAADPYERFERALLEMQELSDDERGVIALMVRLKQSGDNNIDGTCAIPMRSIVVCQLLVKYHQQCGNVLSWSMRYRGYVYVPIPPLKCLLNHLAPLMIPPTRFHGGGGNSSPASVESSSPLVSSSVANGNNKRQAASSPISISPSGSPPPNDVEEEENNSSVPGTPFVPMPSALHEAALLYDHTPPREVTPPGVYLDLTEFQSKIQAATSSSDLVARMAESVARRFGESPPKLATRTYTAESRIVLRTSQSPTPSPTLVQLPPSSGRRSAPGSHILRRNCGLASSPLTAQQEDYSLGQRCRAHSFGSNNSSDNNSNSSSILPLITPP